MMRHKGNRTRIEPVIMSKTNSSMPQICPSSANKYPHPSNSVSLATQKDVEILEADMDDEDEETRETPELPFFHLKTEAGEIKYQPTDFSNHTDFLRAVIELSLAFNSPEVDPAFKEVLRKALHAYENGDEFGSSSHGYDYEYDEDYEEVEEEDYVAAKLEELREHQKKQEAVDKFTSNLPETDEMRLQILSTEGCNMTQTRRVICKQAEISRADANKLLEEKIAFTLPSAKAKNVYVQLRMLDAVLSIKPIGTVKPQASTTKKSSAAKKAANKKIAPKKPIRTFNITGREKISRADGTISN